MIKKGFKYLTKEELNDIIGLCCTLFEPKYLLFYKTLFYFLYYTGIKNYELYSLKREQVDLENNTISLEKRNIYFPNIVKDLLKSYFNSVSEETSLFVMHQSMLMELFNRINKFLSKKKKITMDILRNSFGVLLAKKKVPKEIAEILYGSRPRINRIYDLFPPTKNRIKKVYKRRVK